MIHLFLFAALCTVTLDPAVGQTEGNRICRSPIGVNGECIGIRQCPRLLRVLQRKPLTPDAEDFLRQSQCGPAGNNPQVCCPRDTPETDSRMTRFEFGNDKDPYDLANNDLLPSDCGKDMTQRIYGGDIAELDEFPWMALLEYDFPGHTATDCGGVLISSRYVLTAAHCVKNTSTLADLPLKRIHLGEYDTSTDPDCIQDNDGSVICADARVTVDVEEIVASGSYRPSRSNMQNDIALVRLAREIVDTNFIKPICLPRTGSLQSRLVTAGWGFTEKLRSSNVKLKVGVPLVPHSQCSSLYGAAWITIGEGQICAGGEPNKDTCRGDSGGPLMSVNIDPNGVGRWTAVGIVSFGPTPCGQSGVPAVYTKVFDFVPWILKNMRP